MSVLLMMRKANYVQVLSNIATFTALLVAFMALDYVGWYGTLKWLQSTTMADTVLYTVMIIVIMTACLLVVTRGKIPKPFKCVWIVCVWCVLLMAFSRISTMERTASFMSVALFLIPMTLYCDTFEYTVFLMLTIVHVMAHVFSPAMESGQVNADYVPMYDFIVHAAQCICSCLIGGRELCTVGTFGQNLLLMGAACVYANVRFLETGLWLFCSFWGIYGTWVHMELPNLHVARKLHCQPCIENLMSNVLIMTFPFYGYLYEPTIRQWDLIMNDHFGVFRYWYLVYGFMIVHDLGNSYRVVADKNSKKTSETGMEESKDSQVSKDSKDAQEDSQDSTEN